MKQIKLEVGKTYRNRRGEEVRIVEKDNTTKYPYRGSDDKWYAKSGIFYFDIEESMYDLIEEVSEVPETTRHTFTIPDGVKEVTLDYFGNRLVVEMVPTSEPKPGDAAERCRIMDYLQGYANNVTWNHEQLCWLIEGYLMRKEYINDENL